MSCGCDFSSAGDLRRRCEIHSLRDVGVYARLAAAMDRLAAAMEQAHLDRVGPYNGERRRVTPDEWVKLTPREREWAHTDAG